MHDARPPADRDNLPSDDDPLAYLDDGGLLRSRGRWVAIPDAQLPVVELLLERLGAFVSMDDVMHTHGAAGGAVTPNAIRSLIHRLRQRFEAVGLTLHVVRGRGVVLEQTPHDER